MKVLVLGASGMLGSMVFRTLRQSTDLEVWGTVRSAGAKAAFDAQASAFIKTNVDVLDLDSLMAVFDEVKPQVVINCIGLIKQLAVAGDPLSALPINAMLPHRLAKLCALTNSRLILISTDCVFTGNTGGYTEASVSDATDLYGKSKYLGEIHDKAHVVTLRTSIIGHELNSSHSLIDWFLSQSGTVSGYTKAIFSGLPTVELARVIREYVIPNTALSGLYHVSAEPIDKYTLLKRVAQVYGSEVNIIEDDRLRIDRSLNSARFREVTGYMPPPWEALVQLMHESRI